MMVSLEVCPQQKIARKAAASGHRAVEQRCIFACTEDVICHHFLETPRRLCDRCGEIHQLGRVGPFGGLANQFDAVSEFCARSDSLDQATGARGEFVQMA
jgi:hypothetical protein